MDVEMKKLVPGDLLAIPLFDDQYGLARVQLNLDTVEGLIAQSNPLRWFSLGCLVEVFRGASANPAEISTEDRLFSAYLTQASMEEHAWRVLHRGPFNWRNVHHPIGVIRYNH